jgi:acyl-CoA reductase-like NAD-dependent aldehyde dehydrogenase
MKGHGGKVVYGEDAPIWGGNPTVVVNPSMESALMREEIFGPILPVITYNNFNEVIKILNSKEKPLVIYYFGPHYGENFKALE